MSDPDDLLARVVALEMRLAGAGSPAALHDRLSALESRRLQSEADTDQAFHSVSEAERDFRERISALELAADSADSSLVEALRQDRWWATYNAALSKLASAGTCYAESVHGDCVHAADVAHGPLVRPLVADADAHNALLRAASATVGAYSGSQLRHPILQIAIDALAAALKPFER